MGIGDLLKKRWVRKLFTTLTFVVALTQASMANAAWSNKTKTSFQNMVAYHQLTKKALKDKTKTWGPKEKKIYGDYLVNFLELLAKDIVQDLKSGKYKEAITEFNQFQKFTEVLQKLERFEEVKNEYENITAVVKSVLRNLKKKHKDKAQKATAKLPNGTFVFYSEKEGVKFYLKLRIFKAKGQLVFDVFRQGLPIMKGQWEEASAGKPKAIVEFVKNQILKKDYGKLYLSQRTEGGS